MWTCGSSNTVDNCGWLSYWKANHHEVPPQRSFRLKMINFSCLKRNRTLFSVLKPSQFTPQSSRCQQLQWLGSSCFPFSFLFDKSFRWSQWWLTTIQNFFFSFFDLKAFILRVYWHVSGVQVPESLTKLSSKRASSARARKSAESLLMDPVEMAKEQFQIAAKAGCDLGLKWLNRLEEEEKRLLAGWHTEVYITLIFLWHS